MCAVAFGRPDLRSNLEFLRFREGFDIVLTNLEQDLYSLIGVSTVFLSMLWWARVDARFSSTLGRRSRAEYENLLRFSATIGSSDPVRSGNSASSHPSPPGQPFPHTANDPKLSNSVFAATFSEVGHQRLL